MAGIMPNGGVAPSQTQNSLSSANITNGCESLWHAARCSPRFDPFAANAVISEIINAVNIRGLAYDCSRLDNLARALQTLVSSLDLCELPAHTLTIATTDRIAGCFNGTTSTITMAQICAFCDSGGGGDSFNVCDLPVIAYSGSEAIGGGGNPWNHAGNTIAVCDTANGQARAALNPIIAQMVTVTYIVADNPNPDGTYNGSNLGAGDPTGTYLPVGQRWNAADQGSTGRLWSLFVRIT